MRKVQLVKFMKDNKIPMGITFATTPEVRIFKLTKTEQKQKIRAIKLINKDKSKKEMKKEKEKGIKYFNITPKNIRIKTKKRGKLRRKMVKKANKEYGLKRTMSRKKLQKVRRRRKEKRKVPRRFL